MQMQARRFKETECRSVGVLAQTQPYYALAVSLANIMSAAKRAAVAKIQIQGARYTAQQLEAINR